MTGRADEILREMHNAYHVGGGECFDTKYCPFERNLRPFAARLARAESEPQGIELVKQLRDALGLDDVARPESPQVVWEETLGEVRKLRARDESLRTDGRWGIWQHRALKAEAEVERMRTDLDAAAQSVIRLQEERDALRAELERFGVGVRYHERIEERTHPLLSKRIERLERAVAQFAEAKLREIGADDRWTFDGPVGEIAREVAQR